ncbi:MAG TPA: MerR family transcriptional regulator [Candidatus Limnocylindrales bacterium]|nr:MerR family transcriptional regulator [Candidatus Limnocylindrales bacterium]
MFTIGPFARLAGVSPKMLRSYDALGLFRPVWLDRTTGYRYYSPAQLPELRRIAALRDVGIGLAEIGRLVAGGGDLRAALERRRAELEVERAEIDRRLAALDIHVRHTAGGAFDPAAGPFDPAAGPFDAAGGAGDGSGGGLDVVVRPIGPELVASREVGEAEDDADAFSELETYVRDRGRRARRPPGALVDEGSIWTIYVPLSGPVPPSGRIDVRRLPACRAATLLVRGPYGGIVGARATLEAWVAAAGLRSAAPLRIVYLQFGAERALRIPPGYVVERATDYVTELQLPVA